MRQLDNDPSARTTLPRGFEERKEIVLFKFEKAGAMLEGHLAGIMRTKINGDDAVAMFFSVNERTDQLLKVHATRQILEKIRTGDVGRKMRIVYQGESAIKTVGSPMKLFAVAVDMKSEPRTDLLMDTSLLEYRDES